MDRFESKKPQGNSLLWIWHNQPPIMRWWFALSGLSIMAVYFVLIAKL